MKLSLTPTQETFLKNKKLSAILDEYITKSSFRVESDSDICSISCMYKDSIRLVVYNTVLKVVLNVTPDIVCEEYEYHKHMNKLADFIEDNLNN